MAALGGIGDPHLAAALEAQPGGALDMDEEGVDRVGEPSDLEPPAVKRAALDRAAVEERHEAPRSPPGEAVAGLYSGRGMIGIDFDQVRRGSVERCAIDLRLGARAGYDRFVVAGEEAAAVLGADLHRGEMRLEECPGLLSRGCRRQAVGAANDVGEA